MAPVAPTAKPEAVSQRLTARSVAGHPLRRGILTGESSRGIGGRGTRIVVVGQRTIKKFVANLATGTVGTFHYVTVTVPVKRARTMKLRE